MFMHALFQTLSLLFHLNVVVIFVFPRWYKLRKSYWMKKGAKVTLEKRSLRKIFIYLQLLWVLLMVESLKYKEVLR